MEKDEIATGDMFGDEELWDVVPEHVESVNYEERPDKIGSISWEGGKPVLSFSSLCEKTKSIFTQVKGYKIDIKEQGSDNYIYRDSSDNYVINIAEDALAGVPKYTAFNHELGHYAFDSFNNQFSEFIDDELNQIPEEHHDKAIELYRSAYNILEDQRIESLMGSVYLGINKRFQQSRRRLGHLKGKNYKAGNPLESLHCAREFLDKSVPRQYKMACSVLKDVEKCSPDASIALTKEYINKIINPWILKNIVKNPKKEQPDPNEAGDKAGDENGQNTPTKPDTKANKKLDKAFLQAFNDNRQSDHRELETPQSGDDLEQMLDKLQDWKENKREQQKSSQKEAKAKVQDIKDVIERNARKTVSSSMPEIEGVKEFKHDDGYNERSEIRINHQLATKMNKMLKLIRAKQRPKLSDIGDELSITDVIKRKARGYGDVFIKKVRTEEVSILLCIDASGSMSGTPINIARDLMATMYKAVEGIKGINLEGVVWSSGRANCGVKRIKTYKDVGYINTSSPFGGGTPTDYAVEYSTQIIKSMPKGKKLMMVVTDGYPNYSGSHDGLSAEQRVRKQINSSRREGISTLGIMTGYESYHDGRGSRKDESLELMFGQNGYVISPNMKSTSDLVMKKFKKVLFSQIGKR